MSGPTTPPTGEPPRWLDDPANVEKLWRAVCVSCVLLVLADLFYAKHGHYAFESIIGFHGFFGFVAFVFVVLAGTRMRDYLMRDEDYYGDTTPPPSSSAHGHDHAHDAHHEGGH